MHIAYLAGIIDGEGCLGFTKSRSGIVPRLTVTNTNFDLLNALKDEFGGHINLPARAKSNWKKVGHWVLMNTAAVELAERIEEYLIIKREQCWLYFIWNAIRPGYNSMVTNEIREGYDLIKRQSNWLNWKGEGRPKTCPMEVEYIFG